MLRTGDTVTINTKRTDKNIARWNGFQAKVVSTDIYDYVRLEPLSDRPDTGPIDERYPEFAVSARAQFLWPQDEVSVSDDLSDVPTDSLLAEIRRRIG